MAIYSARKARRALVDTVVFRAISQIATIIGFIVLVRAMPEEDFGVFNLLYAVIPVLSAVASLGLEQTLRRYQPEYLASGNVQAARWLVRFVASARFGTNVILLTLILLAWNWLAPIFKITPYRIEFAFFCLLVLLHFQARILKLSLAANMLHRFSVGGLALLSVAKLIVYALFAFHGNLTLSKAIFADTTAFALAYGLMLYAYRRHCLPPQGPRFRPPSTERKRLIRYGLLNNFNDAGTMTLGTKSDNFFIAAFLDPVSVAVYAFYNRLDEMLAGLQPVRAFENVVQPLFFAVPLTQARERVPRYFSLLLNTTLLLQWPVLAMSVAYHSHIVAIVFGGKFSEYSLLFPIIVSFSMLRVIEKPATLVAQYEEKAGIILLSKIFAIYNVAALLVAIPIAGVYGAALATGTATFFKNAFIWWHVRKTARWLNVGSALAYGISFWGSAVVACMLTNSLLDVAPIIELFFGAAIISVTGLVFLRTPAISRSDREILGNVLGGKEARLLRYIGVLERPPRPRHH